MNETQRPSVIDELERLSHLHTQGKLSDDEFAKLKAKLVDGT